MTLLSNLLKVYCCYLYLDVTVHMLCKSQGTERSKQKEILWCKHLITFKDGTIGDSSRGGAWSPYFGQEKEKSQKGEKLAGQAKQTPPPL